MPGTPVQTLDPENRLPVAKYEYVNVTFPTADADLDVAHTLHPVDPEAVRYTIVRQSSGAVVYQDFSGTRRPWQPTHVILRASQPGTVRLRLYLESETGAAAATWTTPAAETEVAVEVGDAPGDVPVGGGCVYWGATLPKNFFWTDGAEYSEETYALLFKAIGTTFNTGGETEGYFRVPDTSDRVTVGKGATFTTLGATSGADTHVHATTASTGNDGDEADLAVTGTSASGGGHTPAVDSFADTVEDEITVGAGGGTNYVTDGTTITMAAVAGHVHGPDSFVVNIPAHAHTIPNTDAASHVMRNIVVNHIIRYQ